jgi:drug/metabolite transporter (DMT)-like permease
MTQLDAPLSPATSTVRGAIACTAGMTMVGTSVAMAPYLTDYPIHAGQAWRYLVAGLILLALLTLRQGGRGGGAPLRGLGGDDWLRLIGIAATGLVAFNWFLIEGAKRSDPAFLAAMVGATPIVLAVAGPVAARQRIRPATVAGACAVAAGIITVSGATAVPMGAVPYGVGFLACEVAFTLLAVSPLRVISPHQLSATVCLIAAPVLAVLAILDPEPALQVPTRLELITLLYMAVFTTAVAFLLWFSGVALLGADRAGLFCGVMPVAGFVAGVIIGTSTWSLLGLAGVSLCAIGIAVGLTRPERTVVRTD